MKTRLAVWMGLLSGVVTAAEPATHIRGATIYDGTGQPGVVGGVLIVAGKIAGVGTVTSPDGANRIDAAGLVVCPGFIDLHTHCDPGLPTTSGKANKNYTFQGCTTVITGNCGSGPYDASLYFRKLEEGGIGCNVIHLAPHNDIRAAVMGNANRAPTEDEQKKMEQLTDNALRDGAWGLATGLIYNPGTYAKTQEISGLARVVGQHGGMYASHIRDEGSGLLTAIEEALAIGREGNCRVHVSHIKASGRAAWGTAAAAIALIANAREKGQVVTADQYPYVASSTSLKATLVPSRYREGTASQYKARFTDASLTAKLKADLEKALSGRDDGDRIQIARYSPKPAWQGKKLSDIAKAENRPAVDIVFEIEQNGGAQVVNFAMTEEDVRIYMKQPWVATASDGGVQSPGNTVPHPRSYGTFPRKIGRYAIQDGIVTIEAAIRSSTGLPADILRLTDRGYLKVGQWADVVLFDPKTFRDTATFDKPHQYPTGVRYVFVNGKAVIRNGEHDPAILPGKVLRHTSAKK
jgi:N-acyl-D-amino-acid deacylase